MINEYVDVPYIEKKFSLILLLRFYRLSMFATLCIKNIVYKIGEIYALEAVSYGFSSALFAS